MYDVVIAGGGVMGCSIAFNLSRADSGLKIVVVERDPSYTQASTTLCLANVRIQFSLFENILISQFAHEVFGRFEEEMAVDDDKPFIGYRREGNLFVWDESRESGTRKSFQMQKETGCEIEWWSPEEIHARYPLYSVDRFAAGTFSPKDGYVDPHAVLMAYKAKARSQGVEFVQDEAVRILRESDRATGLQLRSGTIRAGVVLNCAGVWAAELAKTADVQLPIIPVKQEVFVVDTAVKPEGPLPFTFIPSVDLWFRSETGDQILLGDSFDESKLGFDFTWDRDRFLEDIWTRIAEIIPAFDTLKLRRGWAGLYAVNTLDHNAILGEWPELKGLFLANGFSGHGFMQSPAVGRYLSEIILGKTPAIDLGCFHPARILENEPVRETSTI